MIRMDTQKEAQKNDYASVSRMIHNGKVIGGIAAGSAAGLGLLLKTVPKLVRTIRNKK